MKTIEDVDIRSAVSVVERDNLSGGKWLALKSRERLKNGGVIIAPGFWIVFREGLTCESGVTLSEKSFRIAYRMTSEVDEAAKPLPEDELKAYEPVLAEPIEAELRDIFTHHSPTADQQERYVKLRAAARHFAAVLLSVTPKCADQSAALRKIREAVMTGDAAISLEK